MKRRAPEAKLERPESKLQRIEELGLNLSSTSDEEALSGGGGGGGERSRGRAESTSSDDDSDSEGGRPSFGGSTGFSDFGLQSLHDGSAEDLQEEEGLSSKFSMYNSFSQKIMMKMGYREGAGLGKFEQGRKDIVEASTQRGRRGLGLKLKVLDGELNVQWQDDGQKSENLSVASSSVLPSVYEQVDWFPECSVPVPDIMELQDWMVIGKRKLKIEDETEFCAEELLKNMLRCKTLLDELEGEEMRRARTRSNPYETIRGVFFLNRAAMKMANIDHVFDYMFTNPKDSNGKPLVRDKDAELLYFADVCAGPGGFSEYVLWRRRWNAKGFGMTLKGPCDFKMEDFFAASSEMFEPYYGEGGVHGDGDITRPENISEFRRFVLENTERKGVHFIMADGGFSVEGQENLQEILCKQLLLCQFLVALSILRTGGNFLCKTFDLFTPFTVGLIYLLYTSFERVSLFKPVTSRPANSERYVVCRGLKPGTDAVREHLFAVNQKLNQLKDTDQDVNTVVPLDILKGNMDFCTHMVKSNERLATMQIKGLAKIHAFIRDTNLNETRQADIRKECLALWTIPDKARVTPSSSDPKRKFIELIQGTEPETFSYKPTPLVPKTLEKISQVLDYRCMVAGGEQCFLLGLGKSQIYLWDGSPSMRWKKLENFKTELPRETLLFVEIIQELKGEGKAQRRISSIHILDALILNGTDIRVQHFNQRIQMVEKFVKAVSKPSRSDMNPIRVKEVYRLEEMERIFVRLEMKITKGSGGMPRLSYTGRDDRHFLPTGLHIVKTVNVPWTMGYSKTSKCKYFYNIKTKESTYELPADSITPFHVCHFERLFWAWEEGVRVHDSQTRFDSEKLSKENVLSFIRLHYQP